MPLRETKKVNASPQSEMKVIREIDFLKWHYTAVPDDLSPWFSRTVAKVWRMSYQIFWDHSGWERIAKDGSESVIVLISKKRDRCSCENLQRINLVSISGKLLLSIILGELSGARELCALENAAIFQRGGDRTPLLYGEILNICSLFLSIVQFCNAVHHRRAYQGNPLFFLITVRMSGAEFVSFATIYSSLPREVVFVEVAFYACFSSTLWSSW